MLDHVNPVLIKELRQIVRSGSLVGSLRFLLVLLTVAVMIALLCSSPSTEVASDVSSAGWIFFYAVLGLLCGVFLSIPFSILQRMALEHEPGRADLQYATPLPPRAYVDGKALCGFVLGAIFFFAALPFMLVAYLMLGVRLKWVPVVVLAAMLVSAISSYVAVLFGATKWSQGAKTLALLLTLNIIWPCYMLTFLYRGLRSHSSLTFWKLFILILPVTLYVRAFATRLLTPASFNRDRPVRQTEVAIWFASLLVAGFMAFQPDAGDSISFWGGFWVFFFSVRLLMSISTPRGYSRRVRSEISDFRLRRVFQYPVFNGGESGVVFHLLMGLATLAAASALSSFACFGITALAMAPKFDKMGETLGVIAVIWFYLVFFALVCRAIWNWLLVRRSRPTRLGFVAFSLFTLASVIPTVLFVVLDGIPARGASALVGPLGFFGNAVAAVYGLSEHNPQMVWHHLRLSSIAFVLALVLWLPVLLRSIRDFKPFHLQPPDPRPRT